MKSNRSTHIISGDKVFNLINLAILSLLTVLIIFPVWNVVVNSLSSGKAIAEGRSLFWPTEFSFENYKAVLRDTSIWGAFAISVLRTVIGVVCHVLFCSMVAYGMSKKYLVGRKLYTVMGVITMFFSGGIIPTYMLIKSLGMLNSFWVYIIPALFSYYDMIILMIFFRQVPDSLEESARMDGAGVWRVFGAIILPLSKPALATIALYHGVSQWNDFMTTKLYITKKFLYPLMMKLYEIIVQQQLATMANNTSYVVTTSTKGIQLATIVVTTLPIVIIYPMLQKHFVTGMMLGAVKE